MNKTSTQSLSQMTNQLGHTELVKQIIRVVLATLLFFVSIHLMGFSFQMIGKSFASNFNMAFSNPAIGLFIGLLGTAILQSSSTTTSMTVAAVAAGSISLENAIPIVMGANVGTTLTSTIVSMSYVTKTAQFKKALSAGTVHDIFNVLTCIILFPLELKYGILSNLSHQLASIIKVSPGSSPLSNRIIVYRWLDNLGELFVDWFGSFILLALSIVLLFITVKVISNILFNRLIGQTQSQFESLAFKTTFKSFTSGFLLTSVIQSSSLTTSLIVPLVATGKVQINRAFQFIVGANIGTTITALIAAMFKSEAAISLAIAHLLFNSIGMILFLGVPYLRQLPIYLADKLALTALKYKVMAFAYIIVLFFLLPFTLIYFSKREIPAQDLSKSPTEITAPIN